MTDKKYELGNEEEIPFQDGPEDRAHCHYRCRICKYSEWVPAWIIDEFAMGEKPGTEIELFCPECGREMAYTGETEDR